MTKHSSNLQIGNTDDTKEICDAISERVTGDKAKDTLTALIGQYDKRASEVRGIATQIHGIMTQYFPKAKIRMVDNDMRDITEDESIKTLFINIVVSNNYRYTNGLSKLISVGYYNPSDDRMIADVDPINAREETVIEFDTIDEIIAGLTLETIDLLNNAQYERVGNNNRLTPVISEAAR